ncbi:MAG: DinB family protein [Verrucomicrobiota bacterium]
MTARPLTLGSLLLAALASGQLHAQAPAAAPPAPAPAANPAQGPIVRTLRAQWQGVRDKVINICDLIPEDKLDYKATPEVRSFKDLIVHIAGEGYSFLRPLGSVPGVTPPTNAEIAALKTKAELMKALRDSFDWQGKIIDSLTEASATEIAPGRGGAPGTTPRWNAIVSLLVDNMDHYGNLVTYVRINGMVPPASVRGARGGQGGGRGPGGPGAAPTAAPAAPAPAAP